MKNVVRQYGLLAGIIALFVLVFTFGGMYSRYMTAQNEQHILDNQQGEQFAQYLAMFPGATRAEVLETTGVAKTYALADSRGDFSPTLAGAYTLYEGETAVGVVYVVSSYGKFMGLVVAFAIDLATDAVVAVDVLANAETPSYFGTLGTAFYAQFDALALANVALAVDAVAGATYSSKGIEIGLLYAREQYAADFGFVIPSIVMTLNSLTYNFDPADFATKPFIADVTYGDDDVNVVVYLDYEFNYAGLVSGTEPAADVKAAIRSFAANDGAVNPNVRFVEYDDATRELVMTSRGYSADPITVTFILNATLDAVASFEVDSHETYSEDYNELYNHALGEVPYVEENLIGQYNAGEPAIDAIAGASVTSAAMQKMLVVLDAFIDAIGGGD